MKKTIIINVEICSDLKKRAKIKAVETGVTFKKFLSEALEEKIKKDL